MGHLVVIDVATHTVHLCTRHPHLLPDVNALANPEALWGTGGRSHNVAFTSHGLDYILVV